MGTDGGARYDPRFLERSPLFWPVARAARAVLDSVDSGEDFPSVEALARVFEGEPYVRFVDAPPRSRRRRNGPVDVRALYDTRIALDHVVPTRARSWHDLMNAFVWGTFPRAKRALHARQHRAIVSRITPGARTLPSTRTRELDALALVDEGGVVVLARDAEGLRASLQRGEHEAHLERVAAGEAELVVFGHAIYESLATGIRPAIVAAMVFDAERIEKGSSLTVRAVDERLAATIDDTATLQSPEELTRLVLPTSTRRVAWASHQAPDESVRPLAPRALSSVTR